MKQKLDHILLGCIADDFTGASDAASFLAKKGIKTLLFNGVPRDTETVQDCAAVVVATKIRSIPAEEAVRDTLAAARWLKAHGAEQLYYKYCSTFDSTPNGNIGPDTDAILEGYGYPHTFLCPALPVNQRMVKDGMLLVDGKPIAEGHMARHPLNPIWDSRIAELMRPQGKYPCMVIGGDLLARPKEEILRQVQEFGRDKEHFYLIPNYQTDADGEKIAEVFGDLPFMTGGSGILEHLAARYRDRYDCMGAKDTPSAAKGKGLVLSGSCSVMTGKQCETYARAHKSIAVYPSELLDGRQSAKKIWEQVRAEPQEEYLVYSAGATDPGSRVYQDEETFARASRLLEETMAEIAKLAYDAGYTRIICAGGETSSAICLKLGFDAFLIGESIAPGVPLLTPLHAGSVRLALKSGNFGQEDFFERALELTRAEENG